MLKTYWKMALTRADCAGAFGPPPGIAIRPVQLPKDCQAVASLYGKAFADDPWDLEWHDFPGFDPEAAFLAWRGDELAGFVISYVQPDHPDRGYISVVATDPGCRRQGIARALMTAALDRFWQMGLDRVAINVAGDNPAAIAAYERMGFRKVGEFIADEHCRMPSETG